MNNRKNSHVSNKIFTILIILGLVLGVIFGGGFAIINTQMFAESPEDGSIENTINADALEDQDDETINFLVLGVDESEVLTDVILLVNLNTKDKSISVLQIPRDTYIGDDYPTGKINTVYGHPKAGQSNIVALVGVLNKQFKITIDHYVTITIGGFKDVVDILGGVEVDVPTRISYPQGFIEAGKQVLDGEKAEGFVRHRASYAEADIGRMKAQKLFLEALIDMLFEVSVSEASQIATKSFSKITTDLTLRQLMNYYSIVKKMEKSDIEFYTIDGLPVTTAYNGYAIFAVFKDQLADLLNTHFRPNTRDVLPSELPLPDGNDLIDYGYGGSKGTDSGYNRDNGIETSSDENEQSGEETSQPDSSYNESEAENPWWDTDDESSTQNNSSGSLSSNSSGSSEETLS